MGKLWQGSQSNDNIDLRPSEHHKFNVVWAKSGNDVVHGRDISSLDTNETISGANGNDTLYGYWGNDFLSGEGDSDTIYGGFGNDIIRGGYHDWVPGGRLDLGDHLYGEQGYDTIFGGEASDRIWGGTGNDRLFGEAGGDHIRGEDGDDYIDVGVGLDVVSGWSGLDVAWGGEGNDTILGGGSGFKTAGQSLLGDNGNDFIRAGASIDYVDGGAGNDTLFGGYSEHIAGSTDFDKIHGGSGDDIIHGDDFFDLVRGGFPGLIPNDVLWNTNDRIWGEEGNDFIEGMGQNDTIYGGSGNDVMFGDFATYGIWDGGSWYVKKYEAYKYSERNPLTGKPWERNANFHGDDFIDVGEGHDFAFGDRGDDTIVVSGETSKQGLNILIGGNGDDLIRGGDHSIPIESLVLSPDLEKEFKDLKEFIKTLENVGGVVPTISDIIDAGRGFDTVEAGGGTDLILAAIPTSATTKDQVQLIYGNSKETKKPEPDIFIISTVADYKYDLINPRNLAPDIQKLLFKGLKVGLKILSVAGSVIPGGKVPELLLEMGILGVEIFQTVNKYSSEKPKEPSILDKMTVIADFDPGLDVLYLDNGGGKLRYTVEYKSHIIGNKLYQGLVFSDAQGKIAEPRVMLEGLTNRHMEQIVRDQNRILPTSGGMVSITMLPNLNSESLVDTQQFPEPYVQGTPFVLTEDGDSITVENSDVNEIQALGGDDVIKVDANQRVFAGAGDDEIYAGISVGGNTLSGGAGKDQFWFYDDHAAEIINDFKEVTKLANLDIAEANEQDNSATQMYGDLFTEGAVNVIVDFDVEEDVIGFADFLVPVGINDVNLRQEGNDSIISLFERDIILLQGIQTESLTPESFVFDNSLFENVMSNDSVIDEQDEQDDLTDGIEGDDNFEDLGPGFPHSTAPISAEELLDGRKVISLQSDNQFLSPLDGGATTMGTDDDELIIANGNKQVFAGAGNDKIYASISSGSNILTGGDGKDEFWFYDDNDGELGINIVENVVTGEGGFDFDVIENYVRSFQDGIVNTITDFNPEEDVIGVVDFPFPLGLNSFESRQEGNDFIISLFERDIILLQNIQEEDLNTENFIFDNSLFEQILANNLNANNLNANNFDNNTNEPIIVDVSSADNLFPEDEIITSPQPDTSTVFIAGNQNHTFESDIAPDFFDLTSGGANIIQGILPQLNGDMIEGFGENDQITIQNSLLSGEQIKVSFAFGSTIFLDIDADGDDNIDSSMTLEGDFSDTLFLVNQEENNTDITLKVLDTPIHRFQNKDMPGAYLFAGEEESQSIRDNHSNFTEEGLAFKVAQEGDSLIRVNRFQNKDIPGAYLFASEEESKSIRDNHSNFIEEGIAFYAASAGSSTGSGIYRFQSLVNPGAYIFVGEQERQNIIQNYSDVFVEEGIVFEVVV
ncbi:leukotoxin [Cyanobacterium aponinum FACHB-4101]|uniref:calcium-binding protein n=1 Tax=Cyanobacterium aponinum TaxID=379064 RepID=UPI0016810BE7|nr:calcium-binding protein [Cyanobacterium aponinum]MBD2393395.1 leukotoxin [Cyanobacterium aponinum FACHB-4101]